MLPLFWSEIILWWIFLLLDDPPTSKYGPSTFRYVSIPLSSTQYITIYNHDKDTLVIQCFVILLLWKTSCVDSVDMHSNSSSVTLYLLILPLATVLSSFMSGCLLTISKIFSALYWLKLRAAVLKMSKKTVATTVIVALIIFVLQTTQKLSNYVYL